MLRERLMLSPPFSEHPYTEILTDRTPRRQPPDVVTCPTTRPNVIRSGRYSDPEG